MALSLLSKVTTEVRKSGTKIIVLGTPGVGKSEWAAHSPKPLFLLSAREDGIFTLKNRGLVPPTVATYPELIKSWRDLRAIINELKSSDNHGYETLVLDTISGFYDALQEHTIKTQFQGDVGSFNAYGAGIKAVPEQWKSFLDDLNEIKDKGMRIIALCHCKRTEFKDPVKGAYHTWTARMPDEIWSHTSQWSDMTLFADFDTSVNEKTKKATAGTGRIFYTERTAAYDAKNRHGLPSMIMMGNKGGKHAWDMFTKAMRSSNEKVNPSQGEEGEDTQTTSDE